MSDWQRYMRSIGAHVAAAPTGTRKVGLEVDVEGRKVSTVPRLEPDERPCEHLGGLSPAEFLRRAAHEVISGRTVTQLVDEWNRTGVRSMTGGLWSVVALSRMLHNPAMAGYAAHRGSPVGEDGRPLKPGKQPLRPHVPVFDEVTWRLLQETMKRRAEHIPARRRRNESPLRGLVVCGRCGSVMTGGGRHYRCCAMLVRGQARDCVGNAIAAPRVDQMVVTAVLAALAVPQRMGVALAKLAPEPVGLAEKQAEVDRAQAALGAVQLAMARGEQYADRDGERRYAKVHGQLVADFERALAELDTASRAVADRPLLERVLGEAASAGEAFAALAHHEQVTLLDELVDSVAIGPSTVPGGVFDPSRVDIRWRHD